MILKYFSMKIIIILDSPNIKEGRMVVIKIMISVFCLKIY
jgi:hypothetical protein